MRRVPTSLRALHTIERLPVDFSADVLAHYPLLKLGTRDSVDFYGSAIIDLVRQVVEEAPERPGDWVLTGPAYNVLPGGPNLLCEYLVERLRGTLPSGVTVRHVPLGVETENLEIKDAGSLHKYHNYSTFSGEERRAAYRGTRRPIVDAAMFRGRSVMFVNDIKVTGTQQVFMQQVLEELTPTRICWLYILAVAPDIASSRPDVEYDINHSRCATFEEFVDLLAEAEFRYTSRCITRLLSYDVSQLERLAFRLGAARVGQILDLAVREGRFGGALFRDKIDLLQRCAGRGAVVSAGASAASTAGRVAP